MGLGMFLVDVNPDAPLTPTPFDGYSDYSTPTSIDLTWTDPSLKADGSPYAGLRTAPLSGETPGSPTWIPACKRTPTSG